MTNVEIIADVLLPTQDEFLASKEVDESVLQILSIYNAIHSPKGGDVSREDYAESLADFETKLLL